MTLQSSGQISHSQINTEVEYSQFTSSSLNDNRFRVLARRSNNGSTISFSDFFGKTRVYVTNAYVLNNVDSGQSQVIFYDYGAIYTNGYVVIDLLMIGGGGGGGANGGGGGGAGGIVVTTIGLNGGYAIFTGAGGAGTPNTYNVGSPGGNTTFNGLTARGGDGGASRENRTIHNDLYGCGGGNASGSIGSIPWGWPGPKDGYGNPYYISQADWARRGYQGYAGGLSYGNGCASSGSGGGGAGAVGNNSGFYAGGAGGSGYFWNNQHFGGGGGGGVTCYYCGASGGVGGGGGGGCVGGSGGNATYYGGGGGGNGASGSGGAGFRGAVVIRGNFGIRGA